MHIKQLKINEAFHFIVVSHLGSQKVMKEGINKQLVTRMQRPRNKRLTSLILLTRFNESIISAIYKNQNTSNAHVQHNLLKCLHTNLQFFNIQNLLLKWCQMP